MHRPAAVWVVLAIVATLAVSASGVVALDHGDGAATAPFDDRTDQNDVVTVAADGSAEYDSIQAAVDAAGDGDTVRVRPGTYRESVTIDRNLTLVAPQGATLDRSTIDGQPSGIEIERRAVPVVEGFTIVDYHVGVDPTGTFGDWELRETTVRNATLYGIRAQGTHGDWQLRDVTVERAGVSGVVGADATGDWRIDDTTIRDVEGHGVHVLSTTGDWTLANVSVRGVDSMAVDASYSTGDWRIVNSTLRDATGIVGAVKTSGDWIIHRSTVANASTDHGIRFGKPRHVEGAGIHAARSNGSWTVRASRIVGHENGDVVAPSADPAGDARANWWGEQRSASSDCSGNVDCGERLRAWPPNSSFTPPARSTASPSVTPTSSGIDGTVTATENTVTTNAGTDGTGTTTGGNGPLSIAVAVVGLVLGCLLAGRRLRRRA